MMTVQKGRLLGLGVGPGERLAVDREPGAVGDAEREAAREDLGRPVAGAARAARRPCRTYRWGM